MQDASQYLKARAFWPGVKKMIYFADPTFDQGRLSENICGMFVPRADKEKGIYIGAPQMSFATGIKDCQNQKDIYAGDIIVGPTFDPPGEVAHLIVYVQNEACYKAKYDKFGACSLTQEWVDECHKKVVGNIFENPELLDKYKLIF
jgi:hypothetical protein